MANRRRLTVEKLGRMIGMLQGGLSQRYVAVEFNVNQSVVGRAWHRSLQYGTSNYRHSGGIQRCTTEAQDRYLYLSSRRSHFSSARSLPATLANAHAVMVTPQTVRNRLHDR